MKRIILVCIFFLFASIGFSQEIAAEKSVEAKAKTEKAAAKKAKAAKAKAAKVKAKKEAILEAKQAEKYADKESKEKVAKTKALAIEKAKAAEKIAKANAKAPQKKDGTLDKRYKTVTKVPVKKDGTPDKRFKATAVKETKTVTTKPKGKTRSGKTEVEEKEDMRVTQASKTAETKVKDKVIGTYNGKKVFAGPRRGKYYINKNGNKTYIDRETEH